MKTWLDYTVTLYSSHTDNIGKPATYREILKWRFDKDLPTIVALRKLDHSAKDFAKCKSHLKSQLQCYSPGGLLACRAAGKTHVISRTGVIQLDFDYNDIKDYDIEELKQAVFDLPFIGFCGLSCSGDGFYALALIAEPMKQEEYAEHLFTFLIEEGIRPDTTKGKKIESLRYLSYDANMMIREDPEPLYLYSFRNRNKAHKKYQRAEAMIGTPTGNGYLTKGLADIASAQIGSRWETVQKVAYTLGGYYKPEYLVGVNHAIKNNPAFAGDEQKYLRCAADCFNAGMASPFKIK
jgi:hypothetical protein